MNWKTFKPKSKKELEELRIFAMVLEGENPLVPIKPIKGVTPRKCIDCGETLPFMAAATTVGCPGGCKDVIEPLFEHDCPNCTYLGRFNDSEYGNGDLYICPSNRIKSWEDIVFRFSDHGPDYRSFDTETIKDLNRSEASAKYFEGLARSERIKG